MRLHEALAQAEGTLDAQLLTPLLEGIGVADIPASCQICGALFDNGTRLQSLGC